MELQMGDDLDEWTYLRTAIELDERMGRRTGMEMEHWKESGMERSTRSGWTMVERYNRNQSGCQSRYLARVDPIHTC